MMPCVNGHSGHTKAYFLSIKEVVTTLDPLKHYATLMEQQTGKSIKRIQTDEGMKFTHTMWKTYVDKQGIIHELTTTYSSASNGVVECYHHTIIECVCVCLHKARLPPSLWFKIAAAITYLMDFMHNARHPDTIPSSYGMGGSPTFHTCDHWAAWPMLKFWLRLRWGVA